MAVLGFDYSMTCPSMCWEDSGGIKIVYITGNKNFEAETSVEGKDGKNVTIHGVLYNPKDHKHSATQRFMSLALIFNDYIKDLGGGHAAFEGYAFGARGRLAQIGENTGTIKSLVVASNFVVHELTPQTIKLCGAKHGHADKNNMADAWFEEFGFHVHDVLGCEKGKSPSSDVIDSYYVRKTFCTQNPELVV